METTAGVQLVPKFDLARLSLGSFSFFNFHNFAVFEVSKSLP